MPIEDSGVINL